MESILERDVAQIQKGTLTNTMDPRSAVYTCASAASEMWVAFQTGYGASYSDQRILSDSEWGSRIDEVLGPNHYCLADEGFTQSAQLRVSQDPVQRRVRSAVERGFGLTFHLYWTKLGNWTGGLKLFNKANEAALKLTNFKLLMCD